jgi:hypothetical protein
MCDNVMVIKCKRVLFREKYVKVAKKFGWKVTSAGFDDGFYFVRLEQ